MSHGRRVGWLLAFVLFVGTLSMSADIERCVTYACTYQEAQVGWDPVAVNEHGKGEKLELFLLGTIFTGLVSLAILRRRPGLSAAIPTKRLIEQHPSR